MCKFFERAKEIEEEIIQNRRFLHEHAELGNELPTTKQYVIEKLKEIGCSPEEICKSGIVATIGGKRNGKVILLRADMDALPMKEESGLKFSSKTQCAHTCGHDTHTAMLLGAAKLLKEKEDELEGTVKLMFQPDEEGLGGAKAMIDAGVLENPKVDSAFGMHILSKIMPTGHVAYNTGYCAASSDNFKIIINGQGGHGAMPNQTIDPINVGVHIHLALQELISRESDPSDTAVITIGTFNSGDSFNIIPEKAILTGTMRSYSKENREKLLKRLNEVVDLTAKTFRAEAKLESSTSTPALYCEPKISEEFAEYLKKELGNNISKLDTKLGGSEDFSQVLDKVPGTMVILGGGSEQEGFKYGQHNPKVVFNEDCLHVGAAVYAHSAFEWLKNNK
ncbi:amidohydrolase [Clostridium botulinum]|uniref:Amidohydrolase n=1 Tax=Clostridium botulinum TaxID=1491 RepID=A0A846K3A7_CLOBO|nr:M20 family metallopeptidase [Clostridium botulinum]KAI3347346.1 M20 family metallopeptidase [Clostridium botulinum]KIL09599.1 peptidase M20 [Clostridium botulinum]KOM86792.1 peptidase M20 [Clostridium botulinum]KOR60009.1 peptidase M20 [Clostridium botulinum]MBN1048367.1 amidohydrolase [Clostridium botulinum]